MAANKLVNTYTEKSDIKRRKLRDQNRKQNGKIVTHGGINFRKSKAHRICQYFAQLYFTTPNDYPRKSVGPCRFIIKQHKTSANLGNALGVKTQNHTAGHIT